MKDEIWKAIKDYEGLYEVSNYGRVRALGNGGTHKTERVLVCMARRDGYTKVNLYKDGKMKTPMVHRLVAMAFIPNPDGLPQVNHIDEDKSNNCVWNLEWCTAKYNMNYGSRIERISKRIYQYTMDGSFVRSYISINEASRRTGVCNRSISPCALGKPKHKSAGGYIWSFIPPTPTTTRALF